MAAILFMSAWPILGHFLPIFDGSSSKLPEIAKLLLKIVIYLSFGIVPFWLQILSMGNFQFSADFHEYTLNMTSYHVTEAIYVF